MQVRWTATAFADLENIYRFIARDKRDAAERVTAEIYAAASSLATMPFRGRLPDRTDLRELVLSPLPYVMRYRVTEEVLIVRILHGARIQ